MRRSTRLFNYTAVCALAGIMLGSFEAQAINIVLNFDAGQSDAPSFDPTGTGLQSMFAHAETFYQDVFEDSHTLTVNYWYDDLNDNTLGLHSLVSQSGGRETVANIRIDTRTSGGATRNWFIDPTPANNSEFNMQQTLWRDLSNTNRSDWYNFGSAPDTFEVGYTGNATAPAAMGNTDMLSVVMHEVGHALGMSSANNVTQAETADGDYDFEPSFIFGNTLAVETANNSGDDNLNIAHLENPSTMMSPSISSGVRGLPSHTDLLAMAAAHHYDDLDLPRREFYGNSNWNNSSNWTGDTVPGAFDDVFIRDAQGDGVVLTSRLNENGFAANVYVTEGANVDTNAFKLDVGGEVLISDLDSDAFINPSGELEADRVRIEDSAEIEMDGGLLDANFVTIDVGTQIESTSGGTPIIDVATSLNNNGRLIARGDSVMTLRSTSANPWDLDGSSGDGQLTAIDGDIIVDTGGLTDSFDGNISVGANHQLRIDADWSNSGTTTLGGGAGGAGELATLRGGEITFTGATVEVNNTALIDAATDWSSSNTVTLLNADAVLLLGNTTSDSITYSNADFSGTGLLVQNGDATVDGTVDISVTSFDFDGVSLSDTTITSTGVMNITGLNIADDHDSTIDINGGTLNVNTGSVVTLPGGQQIFLPTPWTMAGELNLTSGGNVEGVLMNVAGNLDTNGQGDIDAPVRFEPSAVVTVADASDTLELNGATQYTGGSFTGAGEIQQDGRANFTDDTTISVTTFNWDGNAGADAETAVAPGVTATINAFSIESGDATLDGYDGVATVESGTLNVNTGTFIFVPPNPPIFLPTTWRLDGSLFLQNDGAGVATLNGSPVNVNGGLLSAIGSAGSEVNASVQLNNGGTLHVANGASLQQDGVLTNNTGLIDVESGGTLLMNNILNMNSASTMAVNGIATIGAGAVANLDGGTYSGSGRVRHFGEANVTASVVLDVDTAFFAASTTTIDPGEALQLSNDGFVQSGSVITGGTFGNNAGSHLTLGMSSNIAAPTINAGLMTVAESGAAGVSAFSTTIEQMATGTMEFEIGGPIIGTDHDWLRVITSATLDGTLSVGLIDGFVPVLGDDFDIITAASIFGTFGVDQSPAAWRWLGMASRLWRIHCHTVRHRSLDGRR